MVACNSSPRGRRGPCGRFSRMCAHAFAATLPRSKSKRGSRAAVTRTSESPAKLPHRGPLDGLALQAEDADATVTGDIDRVAVLVQRHVVNVRLHLFLLERLL